VSADGSVLAGIQRVGTGGGRRRPVRWTQAQASELLGSDLPADADAERSLVSADGSVVVVNMFSSETGQVAWHWTRETGLVPLGRLDPADPSSNSIAAALSADGLVVVGRGDGHAIRWTAGTGFQRLDPKPAEEAALSQAFGVSEDGSVIVGEIGTASGVAAFVWDEKSGIRLLADLLEDEHGADLTGYDLTRALDVSDDGRRIVGTGRGPDGSGIWFAVIPEPGTALLLASGLGALGALRRA